MISSVPMDLNILRLMASKFVSGAATSPVSSDPHIRRPLDISPWGLPDMSSRSRPRRAPGFSPQASPGHPAPLSPSQQTPSGSLRLLLASPLRPHPAVKRGRPRATRGHPGDTGPYSPRKGAPRAPGPRVQDEAGPLGGGGRGWEMLTGREVESAETPEARLRGSKTEKIHGLWTW